jgi:hypothetical protein
MAADALRCPSCSGTLSSPGAGRCEWCGATLPRAAPPASAAGAPPDDGRDRIAAALERLQAGAAAPARSRGAGCLFFVLLLLAVGVVLYFTLAPTRVAPAPTAAPTEVERADPPR